MFAQAADDPTQALPFPENFDAAKYLGKWYEIARLPTPEQPANTMATAEYSAGEAEGEVVVKNTAYFADGKQIRAIAGKAQIQPGDPPRLKVSFGPVLPSEPNYFIMHVSNDYDLALVGNPSRKALWILSRQSTVPDDQIQQMIAIAKEAGFKTEDLVISDWSKVDLQQDNQKIPQPQILGTWNYVEGEKNGESLDEQHFQGQSIQISEKEMTLKSEQFVIVMAYEFVEDTQPQAVKLTITKSPFGTGQSSEGIIALEDGKLKLCYSPMGGQRPKTFDGSNGSNQHYFILKPAPR